MWWIWLLIGFLVGAVGCWLYLTAGLAGMHVGTLKLGDPITIRISNADPLNRHLKTVVFKVDYTDIRESNNDYSDN